ncbi:hypothetical protein EB231_34320 [Mesorhizobium sp. NZP2298]|nr:hypothetical protein EB231_34320 [Mesorhizobium sp. NZP2298]
MMAQWRALRLAAAVVQNPQHAELIGGIIFFPRTWSIWNGMAACPGARTRVAFEPDGRKIDDKCRRNVLKTAVNMERNVRSGCTRQVLMVCCRSAENE